MEGVEGGGKLFAREPIESRRPSASGGEPSRNFLLLLNWIFLVARVNQECEAKFSARQAAALRRLAAGSSD